MKEIKFETAVLAKEKSFKEEVLYAVDCKNEYYQKERNFYNFNDEKWPELLSAPSQSQLQTWLRDNFNIHIEISLKFDHQKQYYSLIIKKVANVGLYATTNKVESRFSSYEDALEQGLIEGLKFIN